MRKEDKYVWEASSGVYQRHDRLHTVATVVAYALQQPLHTPCYNCCNSYSIPVATVIQQASQWLSADCLPHRPAAASSVIRLS